MKPVFPEWVRLEWVARIIVMRAAAYTQVDIAAALGTTQSTVSRYHLAIREAAKKRTPEQLAAWAAQAVEVMKKVQA